MKKGEARQSISAGPCRSPAAESLQFVRSSGTIFSGRSQLPPVQYFISRPSRRKRAGEAKAGGYRTGDEETLVGVAAPAAFWGCGGRPGSGDGIAGRHGLPPGWRGPLDAGLRTGGVASFGKALPDGGGLQDPLCPDRADAAGIEDLLAAGDIQRILTIQENYFRDYTVQTSSSPPSPVPRPSTAGRLTRS